MNKPYFAIYLLPNPETKPVQPSTPFSSQGNKLYSRCIFSQRTKAGQFDTWKIKNKKTVLLSQSSSSVLLHWKGREIFSSKGVQWSVEGRTFLFPDLHTLSQVPHILLMVLHQR